MALVSSEAFHDNLFHDEKQVKRERSLLKHLCVPLII